MRNQTKEQRNHNQPIPMRNQPKEHTEKSLPITQTTIQNYRKTKRLTERKKKKERKKEEEEEDEEEEEKEDKEKRQSRETYGEGRAKQREEMEASCTRRVEMR